MGAPINHKTVFFKAFAYGNTFNQTEKSDIIRTNVTKGLAYVPVVGALAQLLLLAAAATTIKSAEDKHLVAAFAARFTLSLFLPFILPIIDIAATILRTKDLHHKEKNTPK